MPSDISTASTHRAAQLIRDEALGALTEVRDHIADSLANNGPGLIDTLRFVLGDVRAVEASATCERITEKTDRGWPVEDAARGTIVFKNGVRVSIETGDRAPSFFRIQFKGGRGELTISLNDISVSYSSALTWPSC